MRIVINILILFFISLYSLKVFSQTVLYKQYRVEHGLPSSEVYSAFQDSKGYIWFATDGGVSKFNGHEFENYSVSDGLTDNTVFLFDEDNNGRVWFGTFNCQLSYYQDGKIYSYKYNDSLKEIGKLNSAIQSFKVDEDENVWIGFTGKGLYKVNSKGKVILVTKSNSKTQVEIISFKDSTIVFARKGGSGIIEAITTKSEYIDTARITVLSNGELTNSFIISENYKPQVSNNCVVTKCDINRIIYIYSLNTSFLFDLNKDQKFPLKGLSFVKTRIYSANFFNGYLWLCVENDGVYKCKIEKDSIRVVDNYFKGIQVSRVFKDKDGGLWFSTIGEGVYYLPTSNLSPFLFNDENVVSIQIDTVNNVFYSYLRNGNVYKLKDGFRSIISKEISGYYPLHYDYSSQQLFIGHAKRAVILSYKDGNENSIKVSPYNGSFKSIFIEGDTMYKANHFGFSLIIKDKETYFSYLTDQSKMWCTSLLKTNGKVWIGTNDGIAIYEKKVLSFPYKNHESLSTPITCMEKLNDKTILIGTKSKGLLVVVGNEVVKTIDESTGFPSNLVRNIHVDGDKRIWVTTGKALCEYVYDDDIVYNVTKKYGLQKLVVNQIISHRNLLYLATNYGVFQLDKSLVQYKRKTKPLFITSIKVNHKNKEWNDNFKLGYSENNIEIEYEYLDYKSQSNCVYQYRLVNVEDDAKHDWITTTSRRINFVSLSPGGYKLIIRAKGADGYWSEPISLRLNIEKPFWYRWSFITIIVIFLLVAIYMVVLYRWKKLQKKDKIDREITELKLKALKAQINPHFIFNTLNSIQHFLQDKDFYKTNKFISSFSKLIRNVLELSEKPLITLNEEIDTLELYLEIESMRFDEGFDYEVKVDRSINMLSTKIPSMIVQPYLENAIWHGLMNNKRRGLVVIEWFKEDDHIVCKIRDNGIGRKKSRSIKKRGNEAHKSMGMSITQRRLILLYGDINPASINIVDIIDNNEILGTEVTIKFPQNKK